MICPSCGNPDASVLYIDCSLPLNSPEREATRVCARCQPEVEHPLAHLLPRWIHQLNIPEAEKLAALRARRYAPDRRDYSVAERLFDLTASSLKSSKRVQ